MTIRKAAVVQNFIELLEEHRRSIQHALDETQCGARDAPGSNVTHSDTSKSRLSDVALGLERRVIEINKALAALAYPLLTTSRVTIGALVGVRDVQSNQIDCYYIVRQGGGNTVNVDEMTITSISVGAPFCRSLMDKEAGDDVEYQEKELQIEFVE